MSKSYAVLPCNGLDKCNGCITKEVALKLNEELDCEIFCPVFYRISDVKYNEKLKEKELIVIDGCNTKCATKLATEKNLKISKKINISDEAKALGISISKSLKLTENDEKIIKEVTDNLIKDLVEDKEESDTSLQLEFNKKFQYESFKKDKFTFRIPMDDNLYFTENDTWVYVEGNIATVGVSDYVQQSLGDIMFFEPPKIGAQIYQFDEIGSIESTKISLEIVSPVGGKIIGVNENLLDCPEYINQNPYEQGWMVKIKLDDFEEDKELIINDKEYYKFLKRKVDEFHV
ncbi:glycine cleavage system protein GcvH [Terrisporobacter vanillatitrophus]|uniref:glycine cleavage system protein GcvH n=1 Tax=Terrisporobacter vanillatitrophus TaxID=3058402 RepID=UPI00336673E3